MAAMKMKTKFSSQPLSGNIANDEHGRMSKWKRHLLLSLILKCGFAILIFIGSAAATEVNCEHAYVNDGDVFTVNVNCFPSLPVKGWEFKVSFDERMLALVNITEGDFFDGYQTFFVANGTIVYGLIIGHGNISMPGNLAALTFHALMPGITNVSLYDVGVCNETRYLDVIVTNGTMHITGRTWLSQEGWNSFQDRSVTGSRLWEPSRKGWNSFGSDVTMTHGWSSFRMQGEEPGKDNFIGAFVGIVIAVGIVIFMFIELRKRLW